MENEKNYTLFRAFRTEEDAQFFIDILKDSDVDYKLEAYQKTSDNIYTDSFGAGEEAMGLKCLLMIAEDDVEKAQIELRKHLVEYFSNANNEENTLLNEFSDDELVDVLKKPDEWNEEDVVFAQALLKKRGIEVSDETVEKYRSERLEILRKSKFGGWGTIVICYILSLLGGICGLIMAISLLGKTRLFNGEKVYMYDKLTRTNAVINFVISIFVIIAVVLYFVVLKD